MLMIRSHGDLEIQWFARLSLGIVSSSTGEIHLSELDKDLFQLCPCRKFNCIICSPLQQCSSLKWPKHLPGQEMEPGAGLQPGPTPFFFAKLGLDPGEECSDNFWVSSSSSTSPCCWGWRCPRQGQVSFTFMVIDITNHNRAESTISKMYIVHADDTSTQKLEWCNGWVLGNAFYERKYQKI